MKANEQDMKVIALLITDVLTTCIRIHNRKQESFDLHEHWSNLTLDFKVVKRQNQMDKHPCWVSSVWLLQDVIQEILNYSVQGGASENPQGVNDVIDVNPIIVFTSNSQSKK